MKKYKFLIISILLLILSLWIIFNFVNQPSLEEFDICFKVDLPGATGRYHSYDAVLCSDNDVKVSDQHFGGDWAELSFEDIDKDGVAEVIIETNKIFNFEICTSDSERKIYKLVSHEPIKFELISTQIIKLCVD
jgi:hypothetical protein